MMLQLQLTIKSFRNENIITELESHSCSLEKKTTLESHKHLSEITTKLKLMDVRITQLQLWIQNTRKKTILEVESHKLVGGSGTKFQM